MSVYNDKYKLTVDEQRKRELLSLDNLREKKNIVNEDVENELTNIEIEDEFFSEQDKSEKEVNEKVKERLKRLGY